MAFSEPNNTRAKIPRSRALSHKQMDLSPNLLPSFNVNHVGTTCFLTVQVLIYLKHDGLRHELQQTGHKTDPAYVATH